MAAWQSQITIKDLTILKICASNYWIQKAWISMLIFMSIMWQWTSQYLNLVH